MKTTIGQTYFVNRTFPYRCSYKEIINHVWNVSCRTNIGTGSKYNDDLLNGFFANNELLLSKKVGIAHKQGLSTLYGTDFSVFVVQYSHFKSVFDSLKFDAPNKIFGSNGVLSELKSIAKFIRQEIRNDNNCDYDFWEFLLKSIDTEISDCESIGRDEWFKCFLSLKKKNKTWKHDIGYHPDRVQNKIIDNMSRFDSKIHVLDSWNSCKEIMKTSTLSCIAVVSKLGLISFSFAADYGSKPSILEVFNLDNTNSVVNKAIEVSSTICSRLNKMPKLFSFMDFNMLLGFDSIVIADNLIKNDEVDKNDCRLYEIESHSRKRISKYMDSFSANKAVHLRFIADDDYQQNVNLMFFYDYVSLLSAYNYSLDSYYLWNIVSNNTEELEYEDLIKDYISKPTEHMYIDGSTVLISTINPVVPHTNLASKYGLDSNCYSTSSHQSRIYSFWRFANACNALTFASMTMMAYCLLDSVSINSIKYLKFKLFMVYKYHSFCYYSSLVESNFNIGFYNYKNDNSVVTIPIFNSFGINRLLNARKERNNILWQSANLSNTQLYNRYGLILSIVSLLITIISYGLVSAVFEGSQTIENPFDFFKIVFKTPKFYFILLIACIPLLIWICLNVVGIVIACKSNLVKKSHIFNGISNKNVISLRHNPNNKENKNSN